MLRLVKMIGHHRAFVKQRIEPQAQISFQHDESKTRLVQQEWQSEGRGRGFETRQGASTFLMSDWLLLAVNLSNGDQPTETCGYFVVSLVILRLFPNTYLPTIFPFGIPSYSILSKEEVLALCPIDPPSPKTMDSDDSDLEFDGLFYETTGFPESVQHIVIRKCVNVTTKIPMFRYLGRLFQSVVLGTFNQDNGSNSTLFEECKENLLFIPQETKVHTMVILKEDVEPFIMVSDQFMDDAIGLQVNVLEDEDPSKTMHEIRMQVLQHLIDLNDLNALGQHGKTDMAKAILKSMGVEEKWSFRERDHGKTCLSSFKASKLDEFTPVLVNPPLVSSPTQESIITQVQPDIDAVGSSAAVQDHFMSRKPFKVCWWQQVPLKIGLIDSSQHRHRRRSSLLLELAKMIGRTWEVDAPRLAHGKLWLRRTWSVDFSFHSPLMTNV